MVAWVAYKDLSDLFPEVRVKTELWPVFLMLVYPGEGYWGWLDFYRDFS